MKKGICQSCSMPLKKDPMHGGTEKDGSKTEKYCSYCYQNGEFVSPDMTVDEMKSLVKTKLKEMGIPGFIANGFANKIPRLERWRND